MIIIIIIIIVILYKHPERGDINNVVRRDITNNRKSFFTNLLTVIRFSREGESPIRIF